MSDDRFTQTTLRAPRVDQDQAIATYQFGTIDLSSFTLRSVVDLTPGTSSTFGYTHHIDDNTAIAFGTTIENVF